MSCVIYLACQGFLLCDLQENDMHSKSKVHGLLTQSPILEFIWEKQLNSGSLQDQQIIAKSLVAR